MGRTACTQPQCLYEGALYPSFTFTFFSDIGEYWTENYLHTVFQRTVIPEYYRVSPEVKRSFSRSIVTLLK